MVAQKQFESGARGYAIPVAIPSQWNLVRLKAMLHEVDIRVNDEEAELLGLSQEHGVVPRSIIGASVAASDDYSKYKLVEAGQLVMNKMQAWNGAFGLSPQRGMISPDYTVFDVLDPAYSEFLALLFRTDLMADVFRCHSRGIGTGFLRLNTSDLLNLNIAMPSKEVVGSLSRMLTSECAKIDAIIAEQERLIALLQEKRQAVIAHAVTKGLNPNVPMKESGDSWLGAVPSHWEMVSLKQIAEIKPSGLWGDEPSQDLQVRPVATTAHINREGQFLVEEMPLRGFTNEDLSEYECRPGDIVVVKSSGSATNIVSGKSGLVLPQTPKLVFSNFLMLVRPDRTRVYPEFVSHFLRSNLTRQRIELMCSTTTYPNLKVPEYISALIPLPPLAEQWQLLQVLDSSVSAITESIGASERCVELLSERRRALITATVTGQVDIRGLVKAA